MYVYANIRIYLSISIDLSINTYTAACRGGYDSLAFTSDSFVYSGIVH